MWAYYIVIGALLFRTVRSALLISTKKSFFGWLKLVIDMLMITALLIVYLTTPEISYGKLNDMAIWIRLAWLLIGLLIFIGELFAFFEAYHIKIKAYDRVYDLDQILSRTPTNY